MTKENLQNATGMSYDALNLVPDDKVFKRKRYETYAINVKVIDIDERVYAVTIRRNWVWEIREGTDGELEITSYPDEFDTEMVLPDENTILAAVKKFRNR